MRKLRELRSTLGHLAEHRALHCVSIYAPRGVSGPEVQKNRIELKNLLKEARSLLQPDEIEGLSRLVEPFIRREAATQNRSPGAAIFHSPQRSEAFELPSPVEPVVVVEDRFHLKPLLALLAQPSRFHILALSRNEIRLLEADPWGAHRMHTNGAMPASLASIGPADSNGKHLQFHSGDKGSVVYHGQGHGEHRRHEDMRRYLLAVDAGLKSVLAAEDKPLVLAGVTELTTMFRMLTRHPNLASSEVAGNVDALSDHELHQKARPLASVRLRERMRRLSVKARDLVHTDGATTSVRDAALAACDGRIDKLFVKKGARLWGCVDEETRTVSHDRKQTPRNEDLLDLIAVQTFDKGGEVFVVEEAQMPIDETPVVAMLRY